MVVGGSSQRLWGVGGGLLASHLAHLIVLSGLAVVTLLLRLSRGLSGLLPLPAVAPSMPPTVAPVPTVAVGVPRLVLHLGAGVLLRSPPLQSAWKWFGWRQFGVAARCVDTTDLDESGHQHDQSDAH